MPQESCSTEIASVSGGTPTHDLEVNAVELYHSKTPQLSACAVLHRCMPDGPVGLLPSRVSGGRKRLHRRGWDVDILPGLRVSQLFSGFFLDRGLIALQVLNSLRVAIVLLLYIDDLLAQRFILGPLLLVDDHPVRTEHDMDKQRNRE